MMDNEDESLKKKGMKNIIKMFGFFVFAFLIYYSYQDGTLHRVIGVASGQIENPERERIDLAQLEKTTFILVNAERIKKGISEVKWNGELATVARKHSQYLAGLNNNFTTHIYISHEDVRGELHFKRLEAAKIYYYGDSGENVYGSSAVKSYFTTPKMIPAEFYTFDEMAMDAVDGWMTSDSHRETILTANYDESGLGIAVDPTGTNYIFTQIFIKRHSCGYRGGQCCDEGNNQVSCYSPWSCGTKGICE